MTTADHAEQIPNAAARYRADKARLNQSRDHLRDLVYLATRDGMTEKRAAELAGVTRMTVRAWLGK